jgi:hypothetical protein
MSRVAGAILFCLYILFNVFIVVVRVKKYNRVCFYRMIVSSVVEETRGTMLWTEH